MNRLAITSDGWQNDGHPHERDATGFCGSCGARAGEYHYRLVRKAARFAIKRLPADVAPYGVTLPSMLPWCIIDRERPAWVGRMYSFEGAIALVDQDIREAADRG